MNRRSLLKNISLLPLATAPSLVAAVQPARTRSVRFAYIGDTHMMPEAIPQKGVAACFQHIQSQTDKPQFVLHGGDIIMDALVSDKAAVRKQWDAWNAVVKAETSLPVQYAIGNHDIWGLASAKTDAAYGKAWVQDELKLAGRYYSFDKNGWHFVVLDSVQPKADGSWYSTRVDEEQLAWLKADLTKTPATTPVLVLSHVPILTATVLDFERPNNPIDGKTTILNGLFVDNAYQLTDLFMPFPNVRACLSGHTHLLDEVVYNNVRYFCNGAVSGNWWKPGPHRNTKPGYAFFDLYDDGTVERQYVTY
ncbi:metallophosphoesterase family protein [Spirosoma montaniterrae]|uniref:Metallophosphoesterase n=1 Tax=Spirosoma montaniterrae TaxID=1178516 RepID=A0A1P9WTM2_9BACT|nr:metallophosphoesterase [Spirosoma montaniterrae]AQG78698.1 metallophosphoesterase [Spirosoma montaniterrae]